MRSLGAWLRAKPELFPVIVALFSTIGLANIVWSWIRETAWQPEHSAGMFAALLVLAFFYYLGNDR